MQTNYNDEGWDYILELLGSHIPGFEVSYTDDGFMRFRWPEIDCDTCFRKYECNMKTEQILYQMFIDKRDMPNYNFFILGVSSVGKEKYHGDRETQNTRNQQ